MPEEYKPHMDALPGLSDVSRAKILAYLDPEVTDKPILSEHEQHIAFWIEEGGASGTEQGRAA